jgi:hypothetical protein
VLVAPLLGVCCVPAGAPFALVVEDGEVEPAVAPPGAIVAPAAPALDVVPALLVVPDAGAPAAPDAPVEVLDGFDGLVGACGVFCASRVAIALTT